MHWLSVGELSNVDGSHTAEEKTIVYTYGMQQRAHMLQID